MAGCLVHLLQMLHATDLQHQVINSFHYVCQEDVLISARCPDLQHASHGKVGLHCFKLLLDEGNLYLKQPA